MILSYLPRLICLSFATFFLAWAAMESASLLMAPSALRFADRMSPRGAARFILVLRLLPCGLGGLVVFGLCIPSYLWLEPGVSHERVGIACVLAAMLGAAICAASVVRGIRALFGTFRFGNRCRRAGTITQISKDDASPVCLIAGDSPLLGITGVFCPCLIVSQGVLNALSAEQLRVALRHEAAHVAFRDNLHRLLLLLTPRALPFRRGRQILDGGWDRFTEWAADDWAVGGDSRDSLALATALVRMARMGPAPRMAPLSMSLLDSDHDLSARVNRLLLSRANRVPVESRKSRLGSQVLTPPGGTAFLIAGLLGAIIMHPATLYSVHSLLEKLIH